VGNIISAMTVNFEWTPYDKHNLASFEWDVQGSNRLLPLFEDLGMSFSK
jgi:hypothetical protein